MLSEVIQNYEIAFIAIKVTKTTIGQQDSDRSALGFIKH